MRLKFGKESREVKLSSAWELVRRKSVSGSKMKNSVFLETDDYFWGNGKQRGNIPVLPTMTLWQKDIKALDFDTILRMLKSMYHPYQPR